MRLEACKCLETLFREHSGSKVNLGNVQDNPYQSLDNDVSQVVVFAVRAVSNKVGKVPQTFRSTHADGLR